MRSMPWIAANHKKEDADIAFIMMIQNCRPLRMMVLPNSYQHLDDIGAPVRAGAIRLPVC
jgi:hypothetical protein